MPMWLRAVFQSVLILVAITLLPSCEAADPHPVHLTNGSYAATALTDAAWLKNQACTAGTFVDYYFEVNEAHSHDNVFFEIVVPPESATELNPKAVSVHLYDGTVPKHRVSQRMQSYSMDGSYSIAVNVNEIHIGTYFLSIMCGQYDISSFHVLAETIHAELDKPITGHICADELLYFFVNTTEMMSVDLNDPAHDPAHVQFKVCTPDGSEGRFSLVTRVKSPPLTVANPFVPLAYGGGCATFDVCEDSLEKGAVWLGVFNDAACTEFTVSASTYTTSNHTCELELGAAKHEMEGELLKLEHVLLGECQPFEWVDYRIPITEYDKKNNLVFEVKDLTGRNNPRAVSVHLFMDSIPIDRKTEQRAEESVSSTYAVFRNYVSLTQLADVDNIFMSVRCGAEPVRFRAFGEHVEAKVKNHHRTRGHLCPGQWIYHYFDVPEKDSDGKDLVHQQLDVAFHVYEGELQFSMLIGEPPIRLTPPWGSAGDHGHADEHIVLCEAEVGKRYYIGVVSHSGCATYDVEVDLREKADCKTARQSAFVAQTPISEIAPHVPYPDQCNPGEYKAYSLEIDAAHAHDNVIFEVELKRGLKSTYGDTPQALQVFMYEQEIPYDYQTEFIAEDAVNGVWSIAMSAHDLNEGKLIIVVYCNSVTPVSYRVNGIIIQAEVELGHHHHGELCQAEWVYHIFHFDPDHPTTPYVVNYTSSSTGHRRQLAVTGTDAYGRTSDITSLDETKPIHLNIHIWRYSGDFYAMGRPGHVPIKLVPPYKHLDEAHGDVDITICNLHKTNNYIGILGGHACAAYDLLGTVFQGECNETEHHGKVNLKRGSYGLLWNHFAHGSCQAGGHKDYYVDVDEAHSHDNIVFEVEDLDGHAGASPESLNIFLYEGYIPDHRQSEIRAERASDQVYSVAMSAHDIKKKTYFLSVKCMNRPARFRVVAIPIHADLVAGEKQHGELCPKGWVQHSFLPTNLEQYDGLHTEGHSGLHLKVHVEKYSGDFYALYSKDHVPVKLVPPFDYFDQGTDYHTTTICDIPLVSATYVGFYGGHHCAVYDVDVVPFTGNCTENEHHGHADDTAASIQMNSGHVHVAACGPNEWQDFYFPIGQTQRGRNLLFEVLLNTASIRNPSALEVRLFEGGIPNNRKSEFTISEASKGIYSLAVSADRTAAMTSNTLFLSVRCQSEAVRFKAIVLEVDPVLHLEEPHFGEVCPGNWVYFSYKAPTNIKTETFHIRFHINKYEGDLYAITRMDEMPTTLYHPYIYLTKKQESAQLDFCLVEPGQTIYLGIRGATDCSNFDVELFMKEDSDLLKETAGKCDAERGHAKSDSLVQQRLMTANVVEYGSCEEGSWSPVDFMFEIDEAHTGNNLVVEVNQLLEGKLDSKAVSFYGFVGSIPSSNLENKALYKSLEAVNNVHSININYIQLKFATSRNFHFAVKCGGNSRARFAVLVHMIHAELRPHHRQHGEVCPNEWVYHYMPLTDTPGHGSGSGDGHGSGSGVTNTSATSGHGRRLLGGHGVDGVEYDDSGAHLQVHVRLLRGELYHIAARAQFPPAFNSVNSAHLSPVDHVKDTAIDYYVNVCDVFGDHVGAGAREYIGIFGGEMGCALYDVNYMRFKGSCTPTGGTQANH